MDEIGGWGDITMQIRRRIVMGAMFALPLLAQFALVIRIVVADGVPAVPPS